MGLTKAPFGEEFVWGVSTAAYQIEGGYLQDGKGFSIWDDFVRKRGKIANKENGDVACDFYHRYADDLQLMAGMNIRHHRFSIAWSRIFPVGRGEVNQAGVDYYHRLIDHMLALGITPWITLYHWDLPSSLEIKGGWTNRDIVDWFGEYVAFCVKHFGDRVKHWMVLNEPMVFTGAGYFLGIHAPGRRGLNSFLAATHHAALAQAHGARIIKSLQPEGMVGTTFSTSHVEPFSNRERDIVAAKKADALLNRLYIEPLLGMGYPTDEIRALRKLEQFMKAGDEQNLKFDMDFVGVQNYTREIIKHSYFVPYLRAKLVTAQERQVPTTTMNWEVYPESIYHVLKKFSAYPTMPPLMITESGASFPDVLENGKINDAARVQYLQDAIAQMYRAKQDGVDIRGYFFWTFLDNFEWAEGYHPRFGLVHVDFETQQRIIKASGNWYADFLRD
ncbi:GH1 family beta-glucosidase [Sphingobacterium sp. lm-10]|uniref:GH1 family beta-glucosidase n=1 Tax=Sphingobacterium sp. lm-10 TaxID=2944904 RepID=UPI0020225E16|nr:GH1 family beta-glucosidase [Sphingobacterium sp. lm-10]MCL7986556.1 GH1 family beta-glucosidase [Sphingobacterium sp. lm-10]